ncbi:MAG: hypothetical protein J6Y47_04635 [Bacteroidales bacterium]|nr:hypothetical protein [Bacteroidales bacterium]
MNNEDFNSIGKQMPYHVPNGYFEQAVRNAQAIAKRKIKHQRTWLLGLTIGLSSAMAIALIAFICNMDLFSPQPPMEQYQNYIAQMSEDDLANVCAEVEYMENMYY